jgi:hypothetical protein
VAQVTFYWQSKVYEHTLVECREYTNSYCCIVVVVVVVAVIIIIIIITIIIYSECYILLQVM